MHTHKASVGFIGRTQKTAKTECGRTVRTSLIAIDSDATCPGCRAKADKLLEGMKLIAEHGERTGLSTTNGVRDAIAKFEPVRYQTVYFL